jgi:hypothetical protein
MFELSRRAWLPALVLSLTGVMHAVPAPAQDSPAKRDDASKPDSSTQSTSPSKAPNAPMTSAQQDHVTASRSDSAVKEKSNDGNRAVLAPAKRGKTTHGVGAAKSAPAHDATTTGATASRPKPSKEMGANPDGHAPVEAHSAVKENPKLPNRLPPAQGAPGAPSPNTHPEDPQNH